MTLEEQYTNETGYNSIYSEFYGHASGEYTGDFVEWLIKLVATRTAERDAAILQRDGLESIIVKLKL